MADMTREILIKIMTAYDKGGMDAVAAELKTLNSAADQSSNEMEEASRAATNLAGTLQGIASASSGSTEGIFRVASGIRTLLGAIDPSIAKGGLLVATFMASYTATRKLIESFSGGEESAEQFAGKLQRVREEAESLAQAKLDDIIGQYRESADEIDRAAQAHERLNAARMQLMDAQTAAKVADVDLREKQALAALAPDDEIGRARLRLQYQGERAGIQDTAAAERSRAELAAANTAAANAMKKADEAAAAVARMEGEINALRNSVTSKQTAAASIQANPPMRTKDVTQMGPGGIPIKVGERQIVDQQAADKQIADLQAQITRDAATAAELQRQLAAAQAEAQTMRSEAEAAAIAAQSAAVKADTAAVRPAASAAEAVSATKAVDFAASQKASRDAREASRKAEQASELQDLRRQVAEMKGAINALTGAEIGLDEAGDAVSFATEGVAMARKGSRRASRQSFSYGPVAGAEQQQQLASQRFQQASAEMAKLIEQFGGGLDKLIPAYQNLLGRLKKLENAQNYGAE